MGDRVSISFSDGRTESVAIFNHWGGVDFVQEAERYAKELVDEREGSMMPLDRFEPGTVAVDFLRHITKDKKRVVSSIYLGKDERDGDNSDRGHYVIQIINGMVSVLEK